MFNQILTTFQGFFTRSFWLGSFLPVAITATLHLVIAQVAFPGRVALGPRLGETLVEQVTVFTVVVAALVVLAYILAPFTSLVRSFLDGQRLPDQLHHYLRKRRIKRWQAARTQLQVNIKYFTSIDFDGVRKRLVDAANAGKRLPDAVKDQSAIDDARVAIDRLRAEMLLRTMIPKPSTTQEAVDKLIAALRKNSTLRFTELDDAQTDLNRLLNQVRAEVNYRLERSGFDEQIDLLPTRVGDARRIAERYSKDTYGVGFDYIWARIQMILPKEDAGFLQDVRDAHSQVSFSVLTLTLALTVPLVWLPILLFTATAPYLFLAIGVSSPFVLRFLYELVVQSEFVFGGVVRAAIDKYRLQVLTEIMHQPLPTTIQVERELWKKLRAASEYGNQTELVFSYKREQ